MNAVFNNAQSYGLTIGSYGQKSVSPFKGSFKNEGGIATSGSFAADIVNRIKAADSKNTQPNYGISEHEATYKEMGKNAPKDTSALQTSLQNTIDAVANRHGHQAATAVMGIIYQNVALANVNEDSLGQGFIQAIKFIDRNFGVSEGNKLMADLNSGVNKEMNEVFDNGLNEEFFDPANINVTMRTVKGVAETMGKALDKAIDNMEEPETGINVASPAEELRKKAMKAMAKRMLANGEVPPPYAQECLSEDLPAASQGALLNVAV